MEIDGKIGEGGGQILRTSLGLSIITGIPVKIINIRSLRPSPGLRPQHLTTLRALAALSDATTSEAMIGSRTVRFSPKEISGGSYSFDIKTAGSVTLLLHALLLPMVCGNEPAIISVVGGTDVSWSPTADYFCNVTLRALSLLGIEADLKIIQRGYYPSGGGRVSLSLQPWIKRRPLKDIKIRSPSSLHISSSSAGLPEHVAMRQAEGAQALLDDYDTSVQLDTSGSGRGSAITIWGDAGNVPIGHSILGQKGYKAQDVGADAARGILSIVDSKTCDTYLPDQLAPFLALAPEKSILKISKMTGHLLTNLQIISSFLGTSWKHTGKTLEIIGKK